MKAIASLVSLVITFFASYFIMTVAWGLEVKSWGAFVGGWIVIILLTILVQALASSSD